MTVEPRSGKRSYLIARQQVKVRESAPDAAGEMRRPIIKSKSIKWAARRFDNRKIVVVHCAI